MCAKLLLFLLLGLYLAGTPKKEETSIPDFVVTQNEFPDFKDLEAGENQSQVFSIWNQQEERECYYFLGQAPDDVKIQIKRKGELFYEGRMPKKKIKLTTLNPGENTVFELTVFKEGNKSKEVELFFENSRCDKK